MKYKTCWLAKQYKKGWKLKLCVGSKDYSIPQIWFSCEEDIKKVLKGNIVFVSMVDKCLEPVHSHLHKVIKYECNRLKPVSKG